MSTPTRYQLLLVKIEVTQFTDPVPTAGANAILVRNLRPTPLRVETEDLAYVRAYFGSSIQLPVMEEGAIEFDVDLVGSGTAGTAPAYGSLLKAAGFAEVVVASTSVTYNPVSTGFNFVTAYYYDGIHLMKFLGAPANVTWSLTAKGIPTLHFRLVGQYSPVTDAAIPGGVSYSLFQTPAPVIPANAGTMTVGGYAAKLREFSGDMGNVVSHAQWINQETLGITDRQPTGTLEYEAVTVAAKDYFSAIRAATLQALAITHGTVAGKITTINCPKTQLVDIAEGDYNGFRTYRSATRYLPNTGNDEVQFAFT